MSHLKRTLMLAAPVAISIACMAAWNQKVRADSTAEAESFPRATHDLLPHPWGRHVAYGRVDETELIEQPIAYSHMLHAGTLGIQCEYCHTMARKSIHAGVPPTETCMGCHKLVDSTGRPELEKLKGYWERQEEIPWVKVHDLPDFVHFNHKRHVKAGVQCEECHGQVKETMTVARRVNSLNMGWCLECHKTHPSVDENYGAGAELRRAEMKDCTTCHK